MRNSASSASMLDAEMPSAIMRNTLAPLCRLFVLLIINLLDEGLILKEIIFFKSPVFVNTLKTKHKVQTM